MAAQVPSTQIVAIAAREGDISECFVEAAEARGPRADRIIRACQDRSLPERSEATQEFDKLWGTVAATKPLGRLQVRLPRTGRGPAREATLTIRAARVDLRPPQRVGRKLPGVSMGAVLVREESPPPGVVPIEWLLLTSLPVATFEDACQVVTGVLQRSDRGCKNR